MANTLFLLDFVLLAITVITVKHLLTRRSQTRPLPPGPAGLPLIGNALDLPSGSTAWDVVTKWGDKWGDIICLQVFGQHFVFLNSAKRAFEMLDARGSIYSDRPTPYVATQVLEWGKTLGLGRFGRELRDTRRFMHDWMGIKEKVDKLVPMIERETHRLLQRLLDTSTLHAEHIRRSTAAIILKMTYGYDVQEENDDLAELVDRGMRQFSTVSAPGAFLVDTISCLKYLPSWVPGAGYKKLIPEYRDTLRDMVEAPAQFTESRMTTEMTQPSFYQRLLQDKTLTTAQKSIRKWGVQSMYGGGSDTTVSSVQSFFLAMTLFPDVQRRAQAEIDTVVGNSRLPTLEDRPCLPYIDALVKEAFRWHPVVPLNLPHRLLKDDLYDGYFIPEGTIVIANTWKFLHDPTTYERPMDFHPDRFMQTDDRVPEADPRNLCFGFGRRICPGMKFADASVFISVAMILAVFDIEKAIDENGAPIVPVPEFVGHTLSHPKPFPCVIKPRSAMAELLISGAKDTQ